MDICHRHNLIDAPPPGMPRFGIRVRLPARDPMRKFLGDDWEQLHWFYTAGERDAALRDMDRRHPFSRVGDTPSIVLEAIER